MEEDKAKNFIIGREVYNIAPGENKQPVSLMTDKLCEELAFPVLFPKGRLGYTADRDIKLSQVKYFNKGCYTTVDGLLLIQNNL